MTPPFDLRDRQEAWADAHQEWLRRGGSARFLYGTHSDRQTGALVTHGYRQEVGVTWPAPKEKAGRFTKGVDGETRMSAWKELAQAGPEIFVPLANDIRHGRYRCGQLKLAKWPKPNGKGTRKVAVPTVTDRLVGAVLLEILEPIIDPILSVYQHGYRSTKVAGRVVSVPGFPGIPRGSTDIVYRRIRRAVRSGCHHLAEIDIVDAFESVCRTTLRKLLIADGCPEDFAIQIIGCLGNEIRQQDGTVIPATGIPLGSPIGPLLFNFFVRGIHGGIDPRKGLVTSYADNFFIACKQADELEDALRGIHETLAVLGLQAREEQRVNLQEAGCPWFTVLKEKRIGRGDLLRLGDGVQRTREPSQDPAAAALLGEHRPGIAPHGDAGRGLQAHVPVPRPLGHGPGSDDYILHPGGVRWEGVRLGNHGPCHQAQEVIRYELEGKPGDDLDSVPTQPALVPFDQDQVQEALDGASTPPSSQGNAGAGGRAIAEVLFAGEWGEDIERALDELYSDCDGDEADGLVKVVFPDWKTLAGDDAHAVASSRILGN